MDEALYTQKRSCMFLLLNASEKCVGFFSQPDLNGRSSQKVLPPSFVSLSPSVQTCSPESFCRHPSPTWPNRASVDDLRLPGLSGHLGATLSNDRGSGGCLAVQTQAADRVLQGHSFGPPLLQRDKNSQTKRVSEFHRRPSAPRYSPPNSWSAQARLLSAGGRAPGWTELTA